jgi:TolB protein
VAVEGAASSIGLFGEHPDRANVPFEAKPVRSVLQHTNCAEGADFDPTLDPSGRTLAFASTRNSTRPDIYVKSVGGAAVTQITSDPASDIQPDFSPDGRRIVFASDRSRNFDIWMVGVDGQGATQLTDSSSQEVHPTWAPDGQRICYCRLDARSAQWELWVIDLRQPGTKKFIGYGVYPHWSPVAEVIVYQRARERGQRWFSIWTLELVNGEPRFPTEVAASATEAYILPAFSPDGRRLVFCAVSPGTATGGSASASALWVVNVDGSESIRLTEADGASYSPIWGRDGRVYFTCSRGGRENVWSVCPIIGVPATRPALPGQNWERTALSMDPGGTHSADGQ